MQQRKNAKWKLLTASIGGLLLTVGIQLGMPQKAAAEEVCNECHEDRVAEFQMSFHGRAWTSMGKAAGCQSCHGSPDKHVDDPGKATIITFGKGSMQSADEQAGRCLGCHKNTPELSNWDMGAHKKNGVSCVACHDIHQTRTTVDQPNVCFGCHRDIRSDAHKYSHHPIIEGKVACSDCHNTHGTLNKHMVRAENNNLLCYTCHADKRGPWIWEHPPVEEDCAICHTPHGSRHESLLAEKIVNLCQNCHDDRRHHGGTYDATTTSHYALQRGCINCHHTIHGSANFERSFTR